MSDDCPAQAMVILFVEHHDYCDEVAGTAMQSQRGRSDEELVLELQQRPRMWYSLLMNDMGPVPPEDGAAGRGMIKSRRKLMVADDQCWFSESNMMVEL